MPYRSIPWDRLKGLLDADRGLNAEEASRRLDLFGPNDIVGSPPSTWRDVARDTARDPMIWFLTGVSVLYAGLGEYAEAAVLASALVPLVGMDAYLHRRTQASIQGLASRLAARVRVWRNGTIANLPARELVPGDLVVIAASDSFPADGVIVEGVDLQADESSLTGEAYPVRKQVLASPVAARAPLAAAHWAFAGTRLLTGEATVRIAYTGAETRYGEIVRSARIGSRGRTPVQVAVGGLVSLMLAAAVIICLALAAVRLLQGHGLIDAALSAATLAVAALPEEYPVVFTFFLGVGVYRLAQRRALVRRAVAVENIGRITCICSDKTGTLTEGRLVLAHRTPAAGITPEQLVNWAALAANRDSGDPLDAALVEIANCGQTGERLATFPFTENRRRETVVVRSPDGKCLAAVKGAPETVLAMCDIDAPGQATWYDKVVSYGATGHKVIACATRTINEPTWAGGEPDRGYTFVGLLAFEDRLRDGVRQAVDACRTAGIRVIVVTGDHPATAAAIARDVGLGGGQPVVIVGEAIEGASEALRGDLLRRADVIARAAPAQKLEIVRCLQAAGEVVAVTGDGVNDVPALQAADIGIAMGERGTRSAREVAAIVLFDDNFRTIVRAIAEGRQLFRNLQLSFAYLLTIHIPLAVSAALVPLAGYPLLYLPIHVVWLELIIHPTALLVFQELPASDRLMPTERDGPLRFFGMWSWLAIGLVGGSITAVVIFGYDYALGSAKEVEHARTMAIMALIVASATITAVLSGLRTWTSRIVVVGSLASLALLVQLPNLAALVHLSSLHLGDWALGSASGGLAGLMAVLVRLTLRAAPRPARNDPPT